MHIDYKVNNNRTEFKKAYKIFEPYIPYELCVNNNQDINLHYINIVNYGINCYYISFLKISSI